MQCNNVIGLRLPHTAADLGKLPVTDELGEFGRAHDVTSLTDNRKLVDAAAFRHLEERNKLRRDETGRKSS